MAQDAGDAKDGRIGTVVLRQQPEDFVVDELLPAEIEEPMPEGSTGPHTLLQVRKRDRTTVDIAGALARLAGVPAREIGFAGRKDRWAVSTQWFSVPRLDPARGLELEIDGAEVLAARPFRRKIRPGDLLGNRFRLVLRGIGGPAVAKAGERLRELERRGYANRFGEQRFGRHGDNAERGAALLRGERTRLDRRAARFLVSALQSEVFNRTIELRAAGIDELRDGDVAYDHRSGRLFRTTAADGAEGCAAFELSPTGPLFGPKMWMARGETLAEEERALGDCGLPGFEELSVPAWLKLPGARRALRARPQDAVLEGTAEGALLELTLEAGCYATVFVEELFAGHEVRDLGGRGRAERPEPPAH